MKIKGGIGNQMFQYALGRKLSIINQTKLRLVLDGYDEKSVFLKIHIKSQHLIDSSCTILAHYQKSIECFIGDMISLFIIEIM